MFIYFLIGFVITFFVDLYTDRSGVKEAKFKDNRERFFMTILWPIFVAIVIYNTYRIYKRMKKDE